MQGDIYTVKPEIAVLSRRAAGAVAAEARAAGSADCGGLLLGRRCGVVWFIIEAIDAGPDALAQPGFFAYDMKYVNHVVNKTRLIYKEPLDLLGLWHSSRDSEPSVSDKEAGIRFAALNPSGAVISHVNAGRKPELFYVSAFGAIEPLRSEINEKAIPPSMQAYAHDDKLQNAGLFKLTRALLSPLQTLPACKPGDIPFEDLLEMTERDIATLGAMGVSVEISVNNGGLLISEGHESSFRPLLRFWGCKDGVAVDFMGLTYPYYKDMLSGRFVELISKTRDA